MVLQQPSVADSYWCNGSIQQAESTRHGQQGKPMYRKLFKGPNVDPKLVKNEHNKSTLENERSRAMNERRFQYYNEV